MTYNKLVLINAAENINDPRMPPGNRPESWLPAATPWFGTRTRYRWLI